MTTSPLHGIVTLDANNDGGFTYSPTNAYVGTDSFVYKVTDANGKYATATVTLTVNAGNVTAAADSFNATEDQTLTVSAASGILSVDSYPAGETLTTTVTTAPTHGTVTLDSNNDGGFTYTPTSGYAGSDSFTYKITDSQGKYATATVTLNVAAAPVTATTDSYSTTEDQALTVTSTSGVLANDIIPGGETGTVTLSTGPSHGTLSLSANGAFTYTPTSGYAGTDSFIYKVTDTNGQYATATVNLTVTAAAVTSTADSYTATESQALTVSAASGILANDTIPAGETVTTTVTTAPTHGTVPLMPITMVDLHIHRLMHMWALTALSIRLPTPMANTQQLLSP